MSTTPAAASALANSSRLLGLAPDNLKQALEQKLIETRNERVRSPLTADKALDTRNAMAKAIYGRQFDWLVTRVNAAMEGTLSLSQNIIGVLDIFGFEIFDINSFEQLCINYCNEKLQQHFNQHVFKAEEKCYISEGIDYAEVRFVDNQDVLDLIEMRPNGLLPKLDDEVKVPKGSDMGWNDKCTKMHADNPRFKGRIRRDNQNREFEFGLNHYAGLVHYDVRGFLEKNKDELLLNIRELLQSSTNPFLASLFVEKVDKDASGPMSPGGNNNAVAGGAKDKLSQAFQFRNQLDALMKTLNATEPHYIRCIKPNQVKKPGIFDSNICLQQLRYAGVFEAVKIRQQGFPFRWTHELFYKRYRACAAGPNFRSLIPKGMDWRQGCTRLIEDLAQAAPQLENSLKFGRTMILYRADPHRILEMMRDYTRDNGARMLQRVYRGHCARKQARVLFKARERIRAALKARDIALVTAAQEESKKLPFRLFECKALDALYKRLMEEKQCRDRLRELFPVDPVDKYAEYEAALKEATRLELQDEDFTKQVQAKFDTVRDRIETKSNLLRGIEMGDKQLILRSLQKAEELRADWGEIVSADAVAKARETLEVIAKEEKVLDDLRAALAVGSPTGATGSLDTSRVTFSQVESALAACSAGNTRVNTIVGKNLMATATAIRDLRRAFKTGEWAAIESSTAAAVALSDRGSLAPECAAEVKQAAAEVADRRIQRLVSQALAHGAARGRVGELAMKTADSASLQAAITDAKKQMELVGGMSAAGMHLLACAELVLKLRNALLSGDWGLIRKAVDAALETRMPEAALAEVMSAKDEVDNHTLIHQLTDVLEKGYPTGPVARLDLSTVDVIHIGERVAHAEEVGPKTQKAQALLKLAKAIRKIRQALLSGDLSSVLDLCKQANTVPREFVPAATRDELTVAQFEGENVLIVKGLRAAISAGGPAGVVGNVPRAAVNSAILAAALQKAHQLKCRSQEAVWLAQVAQALKDMREGYREGSWVILQELILAVKAMDRTRPSMRGRSHADDTDSPTPIGMINRPASRASIMRGASFANVVTNVMDGNSIGVASRTPIISMGGRSLDSTGMNKRMSLSGPALQAMLAAAAEAAEDTSGTLTDDPTFAFPAAVRDELALVQDELFNHNIIMDMSRALAHGAPNGAVGELETVGLDVDSLNNAVKRSERLGAKTPQAASLIYTGRIVRDLRAALVSNDWTAVEAQLRVVAANNARVVRFATEGTAYAPNDPAPLAGIPTSSLGRVEIPSHAEDDVVLQQAAITLSQCGMVEVARAELEAEYRRVMAMMSAALETDGPTSADGVLDISSVQVQAIADAIDASRALGARTDRSRHLTTLCRLMWQMRTAVLEEDWASVESLLSASGEVLGKTAPLPFGCDVPATLLREVDLYRIEANNRRIVKALADAINDGAALGEIGALDIGSIDVRKLEEGIRIGLQLGCETREAKCLAATAVHLRSMRLALMGGQWDRLGELLDYLHNAVQMHHGKEQAYGLAYLALLSGASPFIAPAYTNTKDGVGVMGSWASVVDPKAGLDIAVHGVSPLGAREVDVLQIELNNRNITIQLTAAIGRGAAGGQTGHLDLATVETGQLEWAIDFAQRVGCVTETASHMLLTATIVRRIRLALLAGDWSKLQAALTEAQGKEIAGIGAAEIHVAQDELNNRAILSELAAALARGRPQGRPGRLYTGSIDVQPLNEAIALSTKLGPKTIEARQMLFTAKVVARLRLCLLNEDLSEAGMTLEAVRGKMLASVAMSEVRIVQDEVDNYVIVAELTQALATGSAQGVPGALDLSTVDISALSKALDHAEEIGVRTAEATSLQAAAKVALSLRSALLADNWSSEDPNSVEAVLREASAGMLSDLARPELSLVQSEVDNRRMIMSLSKALATGAASGAVGELDLRSIETADLDAAIADATDTGTKTDEGSRLLQAAKVIRRLRSVLLSGNWQWVGSVLLEARNCKNTFPQISLKELQLAQDELDNRAILAQLTSALRSGVASGAVGAIRIDAIDINVLDEALTYVRTLGVKSSEASQLVATAQAVRKLRVALRAGSMGDAREVLESIRGKVLSGVADEEMHFVRQCVDDWLVVTELGTALLSGAASGTVGEVDPRSVKVEVLDQAIALAMKLGTHTAEARRCLVTALIVRRVRDAILNSDYDFLAQAVADADREGDAIVPTARNEIAFARDMLSFRHVMHSVSLAVDNQDESSLIDSLARASRLNLAEHPRTNVRESIDAATLSLGRIQRCKASLASGIKSLDAPTLIDALAMAAGIGLSNPLVDEAKRVLATVQQLTDRATRSMRAMDAVEMRAALDDCEAIGLQVSVLGDIRRMLALPRGDFLRRELAAVLAQASSSSSPSALHVPLADGARAPTALEQRVVFCTLQLKDSFFAETAEAATEDAKSNMDENVRGATHRTLHVPALGAYAWALAGSTSGSQDAFSPGGRQTAIGGAVIGGNVAHSQSRLRKQFELAKFGRVKPAHMFSRKYGVSDNVDTGLLRWQHEPIHTSLTMLQDPNSRRLAVKSFRNILAFMGDRPLAKPVALAQELLEMGSAVPELRDEIFVQLAKQLSGNPSSASAERGWVLMHLALSTFPPSEDLENHLELFLRDHGALPCVWAMHLALYRQGAGIAGPPSVNEIQFALERARAPALPVLSFEIPATDDYALEDEDDASSSEGPGALPLPGAYGAAVSAALRKTGGYMRSPNMASPGDSGARLQFEDGGNIDSRIAAISRSLAEM
jgi:sugar diacid utilization regulator